MNRHEPQRRPRTMPRSRRAGRGGTLVGIFIGLVLGLAIAAAVAYYLGRSGLAYPAPAGSVLREPARGAAAEGAGSGAASEKPRFDFYKILPAAEEPKVGADRKAVERPIERPAEKTPPVAMTKPGESSAAKPGERFWLQAGSFASESEADDMKARLALSGWEAGVQTATLPDKGVRYRVRLGPYDNTDELNRVKSDLGKRGFDVAVIKNQ